jgi:molybdopterin converting factor subunit 1
MKRVKVLLFATLRDYVGAPSVEVELPPHATIRDLEEHLIAMYPRLDIVRNSMMAAVNREFAADEQIIPDGAEVAFFPPVSGG